MTDRYRVAPAAYLLLEREGQAPAEKELLLLRRYNTGYRDGEYSLIAGHLDAGESLAQTLAREALEEAGIIIDPGALVHAHTMHARPEKPGDLGDERIDFYFTTSRYEGTPRIMEPDKCDGMAWFPEDRLPDNIIPKVREAIAHIRAGTHFSEVGW